MRYSIGSISKQFTATAILLLQEQGKLSLDDKVAKFIPNLTRANEVKIRQLLSHTSGYQDYWPQDYVMPMMLQPTTAQRILDQWARKPLDFDPGSRMAIQQHELRDRRSDRGESQWNAAARFSSSKHIRPARNGQRDQHRPGKIRRL